MIIAFQMVFKTEEHLPLPGPRVALDNSFVVLYKT